jgi:aminopeptidase YwaD
MTASTRLSEKAEVYLQRLCLDVPHRRVGSSGNRASTAFFAEVMASFGFETECAEFECIDWTHGAVHLRVGGQAHEAFVSPYSLGCEVRAPLVVVSSIEELEAVEAKDRVLLVQGDIAKEQLMPKNFSFYNPDHHKRIIHLLEIKGPQAIVAATTRDAQMAGGVYPFPLIEDGDFDIPSAHMTDEEGQRLAAKAGEEVWLYIEARRVPAKGCNVIARKGGHPGRRVVVCAHIDAKEDAPGALDNATGITVLLLLAELLEGYEGDLAIEIAALNGEDYYSAPGEMLYLAQNAGRFEEIVLAINLDGAGYQRGKTVYSLYDCPDDVARAVRQAFSAHADIVEGQPWYQSDHMLFVQNARPALAITSDLFEELWTDVAHTPRDRPQIVDCAKLADIALALHELLVGLDRVPS